MTYPERTQSQAATGDTARRIIDAVEKGSDITNDRARRAFAEARSEWSNEKRAKTADGTEK